MPVQPHEYEDLVEKLFDDRLTEAELQRLNDVLRQSPEAREHYWHLVMLEGCLVDLPGWISGQQYATQLAFSETLEAFIEMESKSIPELQTYLTLTESDSASESEPLNWQDVRLVGQWMLRSLVHQKATWGVAAAAMIAVIVLVYFSWFRGEPTHQPLQIVEQPPDREQTPSVPAEPIPVAILRHQFIPSDASGGVLPLGALLAEGHQIDLQAGDAMQLEYRSGVSVILQGPGVFELATAEQVRMEYGRISALVPPEGKGFTVSTEQTDFIDHGTEFVVDLDESGHGEIAVLDGLVEAKQAAGGNDQSSEDAESIMIHEGIGGRLSPDEALPQSVESIDEEQANRYTRRWDDIVYRPQLAGEITYPKTPPTSLAVGKTISTNPQLIPERRAVVLEEALSLNSKRANREIIDKLGLQVDAEEDYVLGAGTKLNSFLIHFEVPRVTDQNPVEREFEIRFSGRIIGVAQSSDDQAKTDGLLGLASIQYPDEASLRGAADPPGHPNRDDIELSDDLRTLKVTMRLTGMDQIRVLVENTDF
jgi:hypothetical protein